MSIRETKALVMIILRCLKFAVALLDKFQKEELQEIVPRIRTYKK